MQKTTAFLLFIFAGIILVSCGGNDSPGPSAENTPEQMAMEKLTGGSKITWTVANGGSVTKDDQALTADYSDFELFLTSSASNKTYTTTANPLFDQHGSWSFAGGNFDKIQLTGSLPAAGQEISFTRTDDKLILMFTVPMPSNARVTALAGTYQFELTRKE